MPISYSPVDVTTFNDEEFIYIKGDADTDGSMRYAVVTFNNKTVTEIEKRTDGIWAGTSFKTGPNSVIVGNLVSLAAAGQELITEDQDGHSHFHVRSGVEDGLTTDLSSIVYASAFFERFVIQADESGEFTGTEITTQNVNDVFHLISQKFYLKTGSTAATDSITIQAWEGTDETGTLLFSQTYPASNFTANTEAELGLDGFLEFELGAITFVKISSDATFSLKTDAAVENWWFAIDLSIIQNDDLLQTNQWISGNTFTEGVWTTQDRKVYEANTTGIQTGTFADNSDNWDGLISVQGFDRILTTVGGESVPDNVGNLVINNVTS